MNISRDCSSLRGPSSASSFHAARSLGPRLVLLRLRQMTENIADLVILPLDRILRAEERDRWRCAAPWPRRSSPVAGEDLGPAGRSARLDVGVEGRRAPVVGRARRPATASAQPVAGSPPWSWSFDETRAEGGVREEAPDVVLAGLRRETPSDPFGRLYGAALESAPVTAGLVESRRPSRAEAPAESDGIPQAEYEAWRDQLPEFPGWPTPGTAELLEGVLDVDRRRR